MWATRTRSTRPIEAPSTVVIVSPWTSTSGCPGPARSPPQASPVADERATTVASQPGMSQFVRRSRPPAPRPSQRSGLGSPNCSRNGGICSTCCAVRREQVAMAALPQPGEHRRELDQLAGRAEDDEDHERFGGST